MSSSDAWARVGSVERTSACRSPAGPMKSATRVEASAVAAGTVRCVARASATLAWNARRPPELTSFPLACVTHYEFGKAKGGPLRMTCYDGGLLPPTPPGFPADLKMSPDGGVLFVGSKGMLVHETYGQKPVLVGEGLDPLNGQDCTIITSA